MMKLQDVILKAMAKKISWLEAAHARDAAGPERRYRLIDHNCANSCFPRERTSVLPTQ